MKRTIDLARLTEEDLLRPVMSATTLRAFVKLSVAWSSFCMIAFLCACCRHLLWRTSTSEASYIGRSYGPVDLKGLTIGSGFFASLVLGQHCRGVLVTLQ